METFDNTTNKPISTDLLLHEKEKGIESHKEIADHLLAAAANHFKAATHLKEGNYEKAADCALIARDYLNQASNARKENMESDFNTIT